MLHNVPVMNQPPAQPCQPPLPGSGPQPGYGQPFGPQPYQPPTGAQTPEKPKRRGARLLPILLVMALVAGAAAVGWWYLTRQREDKALFPHLTGLTAAPSVAWTATVLPTESARGTADGYVIAAGAEGGGTVRLLEWADGTQRWSTDINSYLADATHVEVIPLVQAGHVAVVVSVNSGPGRLLVLNSQNGEITHDHRVASGGYGYELPSGAYYHYHQTEAGNGTLAKYKSLEDFDKQWDVQGIGGFQDGSYPVVVERQGRVDVCSGSVEYAYVGFCWWSYHAKDGTKTPWFSTTEWFLATGEYVITQRTDQKTAVFDGNEKELWSKELPGDMRAAEAGALLAWSTEDGKASRIDLRTGDVKWTSSADWNNVYVEAHGDQVILLEPQGDQNLGPLNLDDGSVQLTPYKVGEVLGLFRAEEGRFILSSAAEAGVTLTAITPGKAEPLWRTAITGYTSVVRYSNYLVAHKNLEGDSGTEIAVLK